MVLHLLILRAIFGTPGNSLQTEAPSNRIHLASKARELFAGYREVEDVEGAAVQAKIVDAAIHVSSLVDEFVRKHCPFELAVKIGSLPTATNHVTGQLM
jgi:hypothetical protein